MKVHPLARQASLIVKELPDETLVYDQKTDKAHCLNPTAARVWKNCDGQSDVSDIAKRLGSQAQTPVDEKIVWLALDQLEKFKLLERPVEKPAGFVSGLSRRQAVRILGVTAIGLPIITSIISPIPAHAQSVGSCCLNDNDCGPPVLGLCCWTQGPPGCPVAPGSPSKKFCVAKNPLNPPGTCP